MPASLQWDGQCHTLPMGVLTDAVFVVGNLETSRVVYTSTSTHFEPIISFTGICTKEIFANLDYSIYKSYS